MTKRELSRGLSISNASVPEARASDIVLWLGESIPETHSSFDRKSAKESRWKKRRNLYIVVTGLLLLALTVMVTAAVVSVAHYNANNQQPSKPQPTPTRTAVAGPITEAEEDELELQPSPPTSIATTLSPTLAPKTTTKTTKPPTTRPITTSAPSETEEPATSPPPSTSKPTSKTPTSTLPSITPSPTSSQPTTTKSPNAPMAKGMVRMVNNCGKTIEIGSSLRHGMNITTHFDTVASESHVDIAIANTDGGVFQVGRTDEATRFQVFQVKTLSYSLSVVPSGCTEGHSWDECHNLTGKVGYNVAMLVEPQFGTHCDPINCSDVKCSQAMLHPFDVKAHSCDAASFVVTVC